MLFREKKNHNFKFSCTYLIEFCSFIVQPHSFNSKQIDRQTLPVLIILKLSYFEKNNSRKMNILRIFGLWDQEIDS